MNTDEIRVLSIRQPWTELVLSHGKDVENRTWTTTWRGVLVLHAGLRWDDTAAEPAIQHGVRLDQHLPTGYLGVADLVDVHRGRGCCRPWGQTGTYHWRLTNPRRFPAPIPAPGRLGLHRPHPLWMPRLRGAFADLALITEGSDRRGH